MNLKYAWHKHPLNQQNSSRLPTKLLQTVFINILKSTSFIYGNTFTLKYWKRKASFLCFRK